MEQQDHEARSKLFSHIRHSEYDALKTLLAESPSLVNINSFSGTALAVAIHQDSPEAIRILLDAGASPLGDETFGNVFLSTLDLAAAHGNLETVRLLLLRLRAILPTGIIIRRFNESELTQQALFAAAAHGHVAVVAEFLDTFDCTDEAIEGTFFAAVGRWEPDVVDLLLEKMPSSWQTKSIFTKALHQAMRGKYLRSDEERSGVMYHDTDWDKHYRLVTRLLDETGIDVQLPEHGRPLLRQALDGLEMQGALRALLDKGVDPNTHIEHGHTALHLLACPVDTYEMIKEDGEEMHELGIRVLREAGASITTRNDAGDTPSHWAAEMADTAIFTRHYLPADDEHRLSINQYRETLLHYAAAGGKHATVELLLSSGKFDVNAANNNSWTPLHCALAPDTRAAKSEIEAVKTAQVLLAYGADPRAVTAEGLTVLHLVGGHADRSEEEMHHWGDDDKGDDEGDRKGQEARSAVFGDDRSAAYLVKELFLGSWELPPIQSPATMPFVELGSDMFYTWGGRYGQLLRKLSESPSNSYDHVVHNRSPLHFAAEHGAAGVARVLRELGGADNEAKDSDGKTPWDLAHESKLILGRVQEVIEMAVQ
jgi:ankyrin repeat protein